MTAKLTAALCAFHADVNTIHKDSKGNFGKYADLATVLSAVLPSLSKNGLAITQTFMPAGEPGEQILVTTLHHTSGEKVESHLQLTINKGRNPLHDFGGATTYLRRYSLLAILSLAAGIEDDDGESAATPAPQPVKQSAAPTPKQPQRAKPEPSPEPPALAPEDAPLDKAERDELIAVIAALAKTNKEAFDSFCAGYREQFGLAADAKVAPHLQSRQHGDWAQQFLSEIP